MLYDLLIIGGGPAGITAGIYAARQKLNTLLISAEFGGQITRKTVTIENYPGFEEISGRDLIQKLEKHLKRQKISIEKDEVKKLERTAEHFLVKTKNKKKFKAKAIIIASGAEPRMLGVKGEEEFIGRGVSYCLVCDGPLFSGKTVAIAGGGNSAFEAALFLAKIAKQIYILEASEKIRADAENQERVRKNKKIQLIIAAKIKEIRGEDFVNSLVFEDQKTHQKKVISVDGVFVEIGLKPATSFVKDLVAFNERGEIIAESETGQTKTAGLFVAGDVKAGKYKQIIIAAGEGAKAALAVAEYLQKR